MPEIFLGRDVEIQDFKRLFDKFLSDERSDKPQVVLVSGLGGIGKSTLLRKFREYADQTAAGRFHTIHLDWQAVRSESAKEFDLPAEQIQPRAFFQAINQRVTLPGWRPAKNAVQAVFEKIDGAIAGASKAAASLSELLPHASDLAAQTTGQVGASLVEPTGSLEPVISLLARLGLSVPMGQVSKLLAKISPADVNLLTNPGPPLAFALGTALQEASHQRPLLISFDTYEIVDELDPLLQLAIKRAGSKIVWVLAGRRDLYETRTHTPRGRVNGYREEEGDAYEIRRIDLKALARQHIRRYFEEAAPNRRPLTDEDIDRVNQATMAIPLAVRLASEIWRETEKLDEIITDEETTAERIVDEMVERYLQHCTRDDLDAHALGALAMASGDGGLLKAMLLPEVGGREAEYRKLMEHVRHRYSAVYRESIKEPRLHDEPARFLREKLRRKDGRGECWVHVFNERAIAALRQQLGALVEDAGTLEELCSEGGYIDGSARMLDHLFWAEKQEAWSWLFSRYVEGLAYSATLRERLLEVAQAWKMELSTQAARARISSLAEAEKHSWRPEVKARRCQLLEERRSLGSDTLIDGRFKEEREQILRWESIETLTSSGKHAAALETLKTIKPSAKGLVALLVQSASKLGYEFFLKDDYDASKATLLLATQIEPLSSEAWLNLGWFHGRRKDYEKAIECHRKAIELNPEDADAWRALGTDYSWQKDYKKAIESHRKALELNPQDATAWRDLGIDYRYQKDYEKAIECHRKALELNPEDSDSWLTLGNDYSWLSDYEKATEYHRKALELNPQDSNVWRELAKDYTFQKDYEKAAEYHRKALELNPKDSDAWNGTGYCRIIAGDEAKAIAAFEQAIDLDSSMPNPWNLWAGLLYRKGLWKEALEKARRGKEINSTHPAASLAHSAIASLLEERAAVSDLKELWSLVEKERDLRLEAEWLALSDRREEAFGRLEKAISVRPNDAVIARFRPAFHSLRDDPRFIAMTEDAPGSTWNDYPKKTD